MLDSFNTLDIDTRKATFSAMSLVSILLLLCCLNKWILYAFTVIFVVYACFLGYKLFIEKTPGVKPPVKPGRIL